MRGPYGIVRHPSEVRTLALAIGTATMVGSVFAAFLVLLVLFPLVWWRTRLEDKLLHMEHGAAFIQSARRVPALVPFCASETRHLLPHRASRDHSVSDNLSRRPH